MPRVFAYGSLTTALAGAVPARVQGYRAVWGVAMDNATWIPGYKRYVDPRDGHAPAVLVAFLDAAEDPGAELDGVVAEVSDDELSALDRRERNYTRVDVGTRVHGARATENDDSPVWLYSGRADSRERAARGRAEGTLVVQRAYLDAVRAGLAATGAAAAEPDCPVVDLVRVDLPGDEPAGA